MNNLNIHIIHNMASKLCNSFVEQVMQPQKYYQTHVM